MAQNWHQSGYIREPETDWKVEWTEDGWHKIKGLFLFHVNWSYQETRKYDSNGALIWGVRIPDLSTLAYYPEFEIAYEIWSSNVISGTMVAQKDGHPITLYAALYNPDNVKIAEFKSEEASRPASYRHKVSCGVPITPDSGVYHIDWSIARNEHSGTADRQPSGSVEGRIAFDSNGDLLRMKLKIENNI